MKDKSAQPGFKFKQFFIDHSGSAMKVGTDSVMLGSWIKPHNASHILDIGTGSGLLAIMIAQNSLVTCNIVGIDIDQGAIQQATHNGLQCPWAEQLTFEFADVKSYHPTTEFDVIVCNPPYFSVNVTTNQINTDKKRISARQTTDLDHHSLLLNVHRLLAENGHFYCVLPADVCPDFISLAHSLGLFCTQILKVQSYLESKVVRCLLAFAKTEKIRVVDSIHIYDGIRQYSAAYKNLCKEYHLKF